MNKQVRSNRPQLTRLGNSTCDMLKFNNMVGGIKSEKQNGAQSFNVSPTKSKQHQFSRYGESTSEMLTIEDMVESPGKEATRPKIRSHRSMEASAATMKKPPTRRSSANIPLQDIFVPPLTRTVYKSQSMPPIFPSNQIEKDWPRAFIDVAPGFSVQLCGSEESIDAFDKNLVRQTVCVNCDCFLYCIKSADLVLCPVCRSISPVEGESTDSSIYEKLGLGLTVECVMEHSNKVK